MEQKRVFITGGTGFVGLNIAELLLKEGWMVVLYARKSLDERIVRELDGLAGQLVLEFGDVLDQKRIEEILKKYRISYVIHGAAITPDERAEADQPVTIMEVNCIGLMHSLLAAKNQGIRRFFSWARFPLMDKLHFQENHWWKASAWEILIPFMNCQNLQGSVWWSALPSFTKWRLILHELGMYMDPGKDRLVCAAI